MVSSETTNSLSSSPPSYTTQPQPTYYTPPINYSSALHINDALNRLYYAVLDNPTDVTLLLQYASLLRLTQQLPAALQVYKVAAHCCPRHDIYLSIGQVLEDIGQPIQALQEYDVSLSLLETPQGFFCKGHLLLKLGQRQRYEEVIAAAAQKFPDNPLVLNSLGNVYLERQALKEAFTCYSQAVHFSPWFVPAICNLSSVLRLVKQPAAAIEQASRAMSIDRSFVDAYICLGNALKDEEKVHDAVKAYSEAVKLSPINVSALSSLGSSLKETGLIREAIACYRRVVETTAWCPEILSELVYSKSFVCDWDELPFLFKRIKETIKTQLSFGQLPAVQPFHTFVYPLSLSDKLIISQKYAQQIQARAGANKFSHQVSLKKLRLGYVSSDFCNHPLAHLMQSVFGLHNPDRFEVILFSLSPDDGSVYRRKIASEATIVDLSRETDDLKAAQIIHSHHIDILINLNGYTRGARNEIFAQQPAPVQVAYMGFPGTLGASYIQFMISDRTVVPMASAAHYSEKMILMPHSYFVTDHAQSCKYVYDLDRPTRQHFGLPSDKFIFACFNQLYKVDRNTFKIWLNVLKRVPNSVLWLLRFPKQGEELVKLHTQREGVSADRVIFTDTVSKDLHINRCYLADLVLDTPLCNGHTTTCDAL
jgi:protein O-GlcNAc transferase